MLDTCMSNKTDRTSTN